MKYSLLSLVFSLCYLPFSLYLTYLMLTKIGATDLMWFLYWLLVPAACISAILQKLADWEEKK
jgi:hypothetical protein